MGSEAIIVPSLFFTVGYIVWVVVEGSMLRSTSWSPCSLRRGS
jgi:hypothetical protein